MWLDRIAEPPAGLNADAKHQLDWATSAGKKTGVYAYAQSGDAH
ncbi:hypothetical protein OZX57_04445 [Bifidobacterium sp. ESL0682]|nr:hypothetical protein [Bifidobacterium sp. ESL0682]WEV42654.1 hypothetical protein OZX57_04445 [Bifidobacterium sp. ESL0682]